MEDAIIEDIIYEEFQVLEINKTLDKYSMHKVTKKAISEISLKIIVNDLEVASLLCLNQYHKELAIGFLFNEGVINSYADIKEIDYNDRLLAVIIKLADQINVDISGSIRSATSGCGKCITYINPLKMSNFKKLDIKEKFSVENILEAMKIFMNQSEIFKSIGGVHSVLFSTAEYELLNEDIGRHNCFDKITGILLKEQKVNLVEKALLYVSGRISSEIVTKVIRLGVPVIVSRSTPTTSAIKLAREYNITLLGYVRNDRGYIYTCPERICF